MAKALVIAGANFTSNRLDVISFQEVVPCTGISVDKQTADVKFGGTATITATETPANTTDPVIWTSSDDTVATVVSGVVTAVGLGSAVITVTCGSYSATCAVAVSADIDTENVVKLEGYRLQGSAASGGGNGVGNPNASTSRGIIFSSTGTYLMQGSVAETYNAHPYKMPEGTTHIKVTVPSGITFYRVGWFNDSTGLNWDGTMVAKMIGMDENPTATNGVVQMAIPSYDGFPDIDSLVISFQKGSSTFLSTDFADITVEFLHIEE